MQKLIYELADEISAKCFTHEQRAKLEFTQGLITVTVADQIKRHLGPYRSIHSEDQTLKGFASIIYDNRALIDEIGNLQEKITKLLDPHSYAKLKLFKSENYNSSTNMGETRQTATNESESVADTRNLNKQINRDLASKPGTEVSEEVESEDLNKIKGVYGSSFSVNSGGSVNNYGAADYTKAVTSETSARYHGFNVGHSSASGRSDTHGFNKGKNTSTMASNSGSCGSNENNAETSEINLGESVLKTLEQELPALRARFWNLFSCLLWLQW